VSHRSFGGSRLDDGDARIVDVARNRSGVAYQYPPASDCVASTLLWISGTPVT
jgi:hypothetical protein